MSTNPIITLYVPSAEEMSEPVWKAKAEACRTATWLSGQLWAWDADEEEGVPSGEAVCVPTGRYGDFNYRVYFVLRMGDEITIEEATSISALLEAKGYGIRLRPLEDEAA